MVSFPLNPLLARYVRTIAVRDHDGDGDTPYRVLPGPYPVIGFQHRGRLCVLQGRREHLLERAGITGLQREARWFRGGADTRSALLTLQPAGAWALFGVPLDTLAGTHVGLIDLLPAHEVRDVEERIADSEDASAINAAIQSFLIRSLKRSCQTAHSAVAAATLRLIAQRGNIRIERLAAQLGIGRRQLERLFRLQVGVSPREFGALARFVWTAERIAENRPIADIAVQAGYADQAHLIRSFVKRTGQTPGRFAGGGVANVAFVQSCNKSTS